MTDQVQQSSETPVSSEYFTPISNDQTPVSESTEKLTDNNESSPSEQISKSRRSMPQDVRYSTDHSDRDKLLKKYNNYQVSDVNACNIRFLTDNRQKKNLFGRNEEEHSNMYSMAKKFSVNIFPGYQQPTKHSYKIFGTENNVRKCLIDLMNRMFKRLNRPTHSNDNNQQSTPTIDQTSETEVLSNKEVDDKSFSTPTVPSVINPDSSICEETKSIVSNIEHNSETETSTTNERTDEKSTGDSQSIDPDSLVTEEKSNNIVDDQLTFKPIERKPEYTFVMLISNQGQEVLKKNWNFFAGSLQQRLNVVVVNPMKLPKFGDKQVHNELSITGEIVENVTDACLQITAFINDVLGVPIQTYKTDDESANNEHDYHQRPKQDHYNYRSSPSNYQSRSSYSNYHGRTYFNRNRNDILEQLIFIRSDCVSRIVGTRGSNLKRIQTKCHLRDMIVGRQANEKGYIECILVAYQTRNLNFAIDTIRSFLRNEDDTAVLVPESKDSETTSQDSPHLHELAPPHIERTTMKSSELGQLNKETGFLTTSLNLGTNNSYPLPSYNFQNPPSFDFTHQATTASRKTDKRRGELHDHNKTPSESQSQQYDSFTSSSLYSSNSPRHKSKRSCPETKEIDCTTDEGFWIQKQFYNVLDDASKQLFDSLIDKLEKIRIANEENVARKQQRLVGRNRSNKTRIHSSSISYLNDDSNCNEKDRIVKSTSIDNPIKFDQSTDTTEEKENNQETSTVVVNQD